MNKTELIAKIAENADLTKVEAARALKSFEAAITRSEEHTSELQSR